MLARSRTILALLGFTLIVLLGACDDDDDDGSEAEDATGEESGGW